MEQQSITSAQTESASKRNTALFGAFKNLAQSLGLAVRADLTHHIYDSIATGNRPLKNALCIREQSTSFFTLDKNLNDRLMSAGFKVEPAPLSPTSPHANYRFRVYGISVASLTAYPELFEQVVRDSINYVEHPAAGQSTQR